MDNKNSNFEGKHTYPAPDGGSGVQDGNESPSSAYSQGSYPQPPEWTKNIVVSDKPWIPSGQDGNVTVQFNEPQKSDEPEDSGTEKKDDDVKEEKREWPMWLQIGVVAVAAIVFLLLAKNAIDLRRGDSEPTTTAPTTETYTVPDAETVIPTTVPNTDSSEAPSTSEGISEEETTEQNTEKPSADKSKNDLKKKEKIVSYFNESSNRVKAEAVKVVKNFEKRTHNEDKLVLPSAIKGVGKSLLESKITDITEPVEYTERGHIAARYPAPGQKWSSKLTADDVKEAICTENAGEYEITLVLKDCVDPEPGKGTSKAMDCLNVPEVRDTAPPFITAFSAEYYDCVIRCRIDKATGRVLWSSYTTPVVIRVGLDAGFTSFDAEIGLTFEKDYTITY